MFIVASMGIIEHWHFIIIERSIKGSTISGYREGY